VDAQKCGGDLRQYIWANPRRGVVRTTERGSSIYVFVMDSSAEDIRVEGLQEDVEQGAIGSDREACCVHATARGIRISLAKELWSDGIPVIELRS